jgi:hypothetical protein
MRNTRLFSMMLVMVFIFLFVAFSVEAGWFGPSNYDECIIESMKGVTSDVAARHVARSCRQKFPDKPIAQKKSRNLSANELGQVTGRAGNDYGNHFGGNLYNGNTRVTVTQVSVVVATKVGGKEDPRIYVTNVNIPPQCTTDFGFDIVVGDKGADYSWWLVEARGY